MRKNMMNGYRVRQMSLKMKENQNALLIVEPNVNVLCQKFQVNRTYFIQKGLSLKCIICAIEKEVNRGFITVTATMQSVKSCKFRANLNYFK